MANLNGVTTEKGKIGANTISADDSVSGLVIVSHHIPSALSYNSPEVFYNLADVEAKGITPEFDSTNNVNVYRHFREFFRMAGEGVELHAIIIADTETIADTFGKWLGFLMISGKGKIRQAAIATNLNLDEDAEPVYLDGIPKNVSDSLPLAQAFANDAYDGNMPFHIIIECYDYKGPAASVVDLRTLKFPKVSLVNGQDWDYAETKAGWSKKYADVGTALGTTAAARINQNIGENESFNLTDTTKAAWKVPGLSSHQKNLEVFTDLQTLEDKGHIFGVSYVGLEGVRWNNDHVCNEIVVDSEGNINEHTIAYSRTVDKAVRLLRAAYLLELKKSYPVDVKTGLLPVGVVKNLEGKGNTVFDDMVRRKEISGGVVIVDPASDLIVEKKLKTKYRIVPYGTIGEISGTINLKTNL